MRTIYLAGRIDKEGRLNLYRKTPGLMIQAGKRTGIKVAEYDFFNIPIEEGLAFPSKEKLYRFMHDRPECDRVFPYIVVQVVSS